MVEQTTPLSAEQVRRICNPKQFSFKSTADLTALEVVIGQERAVRAISFGIDIKSPGYHMYALGPVGTGKATTIKQFLDHKASDQPRPDDWCYVNNFDNPDKPKALRLPTGRGVAFYNDANRLIDDLYVEIPQIFEGDEYQKEREQLDEHLQDERQKIVQDMEEKADESGFALMQTPQGIMFAPVIDGEMVTPAMFKEFSDEKRQEIDSKREALQTEMRETMRLIRQLQTKMRDTLRQLDRKIVGEAIKHLLDTLREKYGDCPDVLTYLDALYDDLLDNVQDLKQLGHSDQTSQPTSIATLMASQSPSLDHYRVNLIVDNSDTSGAPVIMENNPSYHNLLGRIDHEVQLGALVTDHTMIKPGALHRANGGYLMVEARDILTKPFAWDALKSALKSKAINIVMMGQDYQSVTTRTLEPEPIPLDVKVVITGNPLLYYLLHELDEEFQELFKVKVDFATQMDWSDESAQQYAQFIGHICSSYELTHFDPTGVARVVEEGARLVTDQTKLATKFGAIVDLIHESSYWAEQNGNMFVTADDVQRAIHEKTYRSSQVSERMQEVIEEGTVLIDTDGEAVGQVNGLSVMTLGDYSFGKPSRITARTYIGNAGVVAIDRETELGGPIHNKGVMILSGYLGGKYATTFPLTLSASLTFEQLYDGVEGDSASSTELYALLSSLSNFPIRQDLAVTGSVNQHGQVQAIGGVNEKIEGFFDLCKAKGLTGNQGVLIPASNIKHLMLREDVVEAINGQQFHIYPIHTIDEGIALLTGKPAGDLQADDTYPDGSVNQAVHQRLHTLYEKVKASKTDKET